MKQYRIFIYLSILLAVGMLMFPAMIYKAKYQQRASFQKNRADLSSLQLELHELQSTDNDVVSASWYDYSLPGFPDYSKNHLTAASRDYPKGTCLVVRHQDFRKEMKEIVVRVNDYGPLEFTGRAIDLSSYAFRQLAPLSRGVIEVKIYKLENSCY